MSFTPSRSSRSAGTRAETRSRTKDDVRRVMQAVDKVRLKLTSGKSLSEALIFESFNPQYDDRLFIESPEKYKFRTRYVQILF